MVIVQITNIKFYCSTSPREKWPKSCWFEFPLTSTNMTTKSSHNTADSFSDLCDINGCRAGSVSRSVRGQFKVSPSEKRFKNQYEKSRWTTFYKHYGSKRMNPNGFGDTLTFYFSATNKAEFPLIIHLSQWQHTYQNKVPSDSDKCNAIIKQG